MESGDGAKSWGLQTGEETVENRSDQELRHKDSRAQNWEGLGSSEKESSKGLKLPRLCFSLSPKMLEVTLGPAATTKSVKEQKFNQYICRSNCFYSVIGEPGSILSDTQKALPGGLQGGKLL